MSMGEEESRATRVILVDDHAVFRSGLRDLLARHGFDVVGEAATGEEAVAFASNAAPDVVVIDVSMSGLDGIQATREIKAASPDVQVLMLSASADDDDVDAAICAGASGFVLKDSTVDEIVGAVTAVGRGRSVLSPLVTGRLLDRMRTDREVDERAANAELTDRERQVLRLIVRGMDNAQIATELAISSQTVKSHVSHLLAKLGVENRLQAAVTAIRGRLV